MLGQKVKSAESNFLFFFPTVSPPPARRGTHFLNNVSIFRLAAAPSRVPNVRDLPPMRRSTAPTPLRRDGRPSRPPTPAKRGLDDGYAAHREVGPPRKLAAVVRCSGGAGCTHTLSCTGEAQVPCSGGAGCTCVGPYAGAQGQTLDDEDDEEEDEEIVRAPAPAAAGAGGADAHVETKKRARRGAWPRYKPDKPDKKEKTEKDFAEDYRLIPANLKKVPMRDAHWILVAAHVQVPIGHAVSDPKNLLEQAVVGAVRPKPRQRQCNDTARVKHVRPAAPPCAARVLVTVAPQCEARVDVLANEVERRLVRPHHLPVRTPCPFSITFQYGESFGRRRSSRKK